MSVRDLKRISQNGWVRSSVLLLALPLLLLLLLAIPNSKTHATSCSGSGGTGPSCEELDLGIECDPSEAPEGYAYGVENATFSSISPPSTSVDGGLAFTSKRGCPGNSSGNPFDESQIVETPGSITMIYFECRNNSLWQISMTYPVGVSTSMEWNPEWPSEIPATTTSYVLKITSTVDDIGLPSSAATPPTITPPGDITVGTVTLGPGNVNLVLTPSVTDIGMGVDFSLTATVKDDGGTPLSDVAVTFTNGDATFSPATGVVNTDAEGKATITAKFLGTPAPGKKTFTATCCGGGTDETDIYLLKPGDITPETATVCAGDTEAGITFSVACLGKTAWPAGLLLWEYDEATFTLASSSAGSITLNLNENAVANTYTILAYCGDKNYPEASVSATLNVATISISFDKKLFDLYGAATPANNPAYEISANVSTTPSGLSKTITLEEGSNLGTLNSTTGKFTYTNASKEAGKVTIKAALSVTHGSGCSSEASAYYMKIDIPNDAVPQYLFAGAKYATTIGYKILGCDEFGINDVSISLETGAQSLGQGNLAAARTAYYDGKWHKLDKFTNNNASGTILGDNAWLESYISSVAYSNLNLGDVVLNTSSWFQINAHIALDEDNMITLRSTSEDQQSHVNYLISSKIPVLDIRLRDDPLGGTDNPLLAEKIIYAPYTKEYLTKRNVYDYYNRPDEFFYHNYYEIDKTSPNVWGYIYKWHAETPGVEWQPPSLEFQPSGLPGGAEGNSPWEQDSMFESYENSVSYDNVFSNVEVAAGFGDPTWVTTNLGYRPKTVLQNQIFHTRQGVVFYTSYGPKPIPGKTNTAQWPSDSNEWAMDYSQNTSHANVLLDKGVITVNSSAQAYNNFKKPLAAASIVNEGVGNYVLIFEAFEGGLPIALPAALLKINPYIAVASGVIGTALTGAQMYDVPANDDYSAYSSISWYTGRQTSMADSTMEWETVEHYTNNAQVPATTIPIRGVDANLPVGRQFAVMMNIDVLVTGNSDDEITTTRTESADVTFTRSAGMSNGAEILLYSSKGRLDFDTYPEP